MHHLCQEVVLLAGMRMKPDSPGQTQLLRLVCMACKRQSLDSALSARHYCCKSFADPELPVSKVQFLQSFLFPVKQGSNKGLGFGC